MGPALTGAASAPARDNHTCVFRLQYARAPRAAGHRAVRYSPWGVLRHLPTRPCRRLLAGASSRAPRTRRGLNPSFMAGWLPCLRLTLFRAGASAGWGQIHPGIAQQQISKSCWKCFLLAAVHHRRLPRQAVAVNLKMLKRRLNSIPFLRLLWMAPGQRRVAGDVR